MAVRKRTAWLRVLLVSAVRWVPSSAWAGSVKDSTLPAPNSATATDITITHTAPTVTGYLAERTGEPADVILLDLQLEDGTVPAENVAALHETGATIRAGASGYLIKDDDADKLTEAIRTVHSGHLTLTTELMTIIHEYPYPDPPA